MHAERFVVINSDDGDLLRNGECAAAAGVEDA